MGKIFGTDPERYAKLKPSSSESDTVTLTVKGPGNDKARVRLTAQGLLALAVEATELASDLITD